MSQNIEIEFKNILNEEEFTQLEQFFSINEQDFFMQENHYIDTPQFDLKNQESALRIREKNGIFEMTLKQPHANGLLESNQSLTNEECKHILQTGQIREGLILELIEKMGINPSKFQYFGSLKTMRAEKEYQKGLIVLDKSFYLNKEDFEIEYEVSNREIGSQIFDKLLETLKIPKRVTENKVKRFYNEKYKQLHK